jgi:hypothetical protein
MNRALARRYKQGLLLVATGERHQIEALELLSKLKSSTIQLPVTLVSDAPATFADLGLDQLLAHPDPRHSYRDKIIGLQHLPYRYTLFLDTDVQILEPLDDLFEFLRHTDLCGCHAPVRWAQWHDPAVPECFSELNSGVIGIQRNRRTRALMRRWLALYDQVGVAFDQATLRSALWQGIKRKQLRVSVLPPEYNLRTTKPWIAGQGMAVKIVHGRVAEADRPALRTYLNTNTNVFRSSSVFNTGLNGVVAPWPSTPTKRLFVLGAGRSGTSLLAGLFQHSGLHMGEEPYQARLANPTGFFEDRQINALNEELLTPLSDPELGEGQRWLASIPLNEAITCHPQQAERMRQLLASQPSCLKDPRFCYTLNHWLAALPAAEAEASLCLCVFRDPRTVLTSTLAELAQAPYLQGLQLSAMQVLQAWEQHYRWVLERQRQRGHWLFLHYDQLFSPEGLDQLESFTGCAVNRSLPDRELRRSKPQPLALPPSCLELYNTLKALAGL